MINYTRWCPLVLAISWVLAGRAAAQVNLLPQGNFEHPAANTGWAEGFNIPNNQEFRVVAENGKHWLRIENRDAGRQLDYVHAYVKVSPQIASLTVSVRLKAAGLKIGKEGWHTARVALMFEGGSFGYPPEVPEIKADSDWVTRSVELKVPRGATRLNIQPAMFYCTGVFGIADLTVTPHVAAAKQPGDAVLPAGVGLGWEKARVETVNARRARVSLDGIWRFMPAADVASPPRLGWGYLKVPGDWQVHPQRPSSFLATGSGPQWDLYDGSSVPRAWYERQAPIPADWQGRAITLRFERVCTDALVYVDGTRCGSVAWPWGSVDITRAVTPGKTADIRVLVAAVADPEKVGSFWQNALGSVSYASAGLETRGLAGSVFLESRASAAHVSDVFVRPSTRDKKIVVDVELSGIPLAGQARFSAELLDEKGTVEKRFVAEAPVAAKETQTATLSWPWPNPRLWDVGQPNLYTLRLKAQGPGLDDECDQRFGFREFWVEGRRFFLNGSEIRLRQGCFYWGPRPQVGENFWELGRPTVDARGDAGDSESDLDDADRKGYLVAEYVLNANKYMLDSSYRFVWGQNRRRAMERAAVWMRHYRNHPSVVMWVAGMNFFGSPVDQDPRKLGRHGWDQANERWQRLLAAAKELFEGLKELDPTRAYYSHAGAYTGDVYTINCYLDLIPLQEREDWLSEWSATGEMPISMVEFGTPMDCTFRRGRDGFTSNITSEPLLTEFSAIYFGRKAYAVEEPKYRQYLRDLFRGGMLYDSSENRLDEYANNHLVQQLYRANTWRSWRTAGLPGGLRTWSWVQDALKENNGPTLAWIAGPAGAYTAKDHHFRAGRKIEKQIVLVNDTRRPQDFTATWTATAGAKQIGSGSEHGSLALSEIRCIPIQATAPAIETGSQADGRITLRAAIGETTHEDTFAFRVFGDEPQNEGKIAVVDTDGTAGKMLAGLGYATHAWTDAPAPLVVVGRNAFKEHAALAARLEAFVRGGGRAVILAQDPQWMTQALGWRICPHVSRRVFPMNSAITGNIDADDLRDWTGSSTLVEAFPKYEGNYRKGNEGDQPYAGWHWGNRGAVASAAIEKPHRSGWRPLLECEFDLAYTPLMELDYGQGRLIVCTLDLEDHVAVDPAARRMAGRIMAYALRAPLSPRRGRAVYLGGPAGAAWLDRIGVSYERSADLNPYAGLVLLGPDAKVEGVALRVYLEAGGRVLFLPRSQADAAPGVTLKPAAADFAGSRSVPEWPEARGLSPSDLRWRTHLDTAPWVLSGGAEIGADGLLGRKAVGKGVALFCQIDPDRFHADEKTYFRYTRWRSTRAVAQLLANLGASFPVDHRIFHFDNTYFNGVEVGHTDIKTPRWWLAPRNYVVPGKLVKAGRNVIAVRLFDRFNDGGFAGNGGLPMSLRPKAAVGVLGYYYPDYRSDFIMGDDPYRYYRW
jgi:beta-galactosidase